MIKGAASVGQAIRCALRMVYSVSVLRIRADGRMDAFTLKSAGGI